MTHHIDIIQSFSTPILLWNALYDKHPEQGFGWLFSIVLAEKVLPFFRYISHNDPVWINRHQLKPFVTLTFYHRTSHIYIHCINSIHVEHSNLINSQFHLCCICWVSICSVLELFDILTQSQYWGCDKLNKWWINTCVVLCSHLTWTIVVYPYQKWIMIGVIIPQFYKTLKWHFFVRPV